MDAEQRSIMDPEPDTTEPPLDPEFLAMLRCPACPDRPPVRLDEETARLLCDRCGRAYPIIDGLPSLIVDESEILRRDESSDS